MSVESSTNYISFVGNNSTSTPYAISTFFWFEDADLIVTLTDNTGAATTLTLGTDYAVSGSGNPAGGSIVTTVAVPNTSTVGILRQLPLKQETVYNENDAFPAKVTETAFDRLVMICQQFSLGVANGLRVLSATILQPFAFKANTIVGFGSSQPQTYTADQLLSFLGATGTVVTATRPTMVFANSGIRGAAAPNFTGQLGFQQDTKKLYFSTALTAGSWTVYSDPPQTFADSTARGAATPDFVDQFGIQLDTSAIYYGTALTAGSWQAIVATATIADNSIAQVKLTTAAKAWRTGVSGLAINTPTTSTITINLDEVVLTDGSGAFDRFSSPSTITVDITTSGLNGLDKGSEAANTWYDIYLISNGTTLGGIFCANGTSLSLPSGYTKVKYVNSIRNNSTSNFRFLSCRGGKADSQAGVAISATSYASPTAVSLALFIPPTAIRFHGYIWTADTSNNVGVKIVGSTPSQGEITFAGRSSSAVANSTWIPYTWSASFDLMMANQSISIVTSPQSYNLVVTGWDVNI